MGEVSLQQIGLFLFLVPLVIADLTSEYDHAAYLDTEENYKLYWSVKDANKSIYFATEVKTLGWVGFGISVGLSGNMKSADMVVGWVDSQGKGHLQDYHGKEMKNGVPLIDGKQDYDLLGSSEGNNVTILKFKRKLVTCDKEDRDIKLGTSKVIYAFGTNDIFVYHSHFRGAMSLNLLNYVKNAPPPKTSKYFDVLSKDVSVPARRSTYWCQAVKLSHLVTLAEKQHIIEIEPVIAKEDRGIVHRIAVYVCKDSFNETHVNVTGPCYENMPPSIRDCVGPSPMYAWAVGGVNFKYPDHVGWPIGAKDNMKFIVLETHFDNPTKRSGWVITSGLRFYYDKPRTYDAGTLTVGASVDPGLVIPPKQENWVVSKSCTKACSVKINESRPLPGGEIKFFATFPHAHSLAKGVWTKLVRNGKEIVEIIRDDNFDFNYQGDEIINYCRYNTMNRTDATAGGLSTNDEMCLNFIMYYPRVNLSTCATSDYKVSNEFSLKYGNVGTFGGIKYFKDWAGVNWNKTMVDELKALYSYQGKDAVYSVCVGETGNILYSNRTSRPTIKFPLLPKKDECTTGHDNASALSTTLFPGTNKFTKGHGNASALKTSLFNLSIMAMLAICGIVNA